jgi:DGQHR domain-containing protein
MANGHSGELSRRALEIIQTPDTPLYLFSLTADEILKVADISRVSRDDAGTLIGYQRPQVKRHVTEIVTYLNSREPLFPNAIILALSPTVRFVRSRGPNVGDGLAQSGTLHLPLPGPTDPKPAWIVDGQQRALALSRSRNRDYPIPVSGFVADTLEAQRDQFLRVNNVQPLPRGLVSELLPEVSIPISSRLSAKQLPSQLCENLNRNERSPFYRLIRRASSRSEDRQQAVVTDTVVIRALEESLNSPSGCLFAHRNVAANEADIEAIWWLLVSYWKAVKEVFAEAWGKPPTESRLMHGVGIRSMGRLMDRVMSSMRPQDTSAEKQIRRRLEAIAPNCHWTSGQWDGLGGIGWDQLQNTPRHIQMLSNYLVRLDLSASL